MSHFSNYENSYSMKSAYIVAYNHREKILMINEAHFESMSLIYFCIKLKNFQMKEPTCKSSNYSF